MKKCKFYSEYICKYYENGLCNLGEELFGTPPQPCHRINDPENCMGSKPIEESKEESKNMKKCKYYSDYESGQYDFGICSYNKCKHNGFPAIYTHKNDEENCTYFTPIEYEKESSPYRLNSAEVSVFSKLFKDYIKDENKLERLVETFESYLSNTSKSPANAEGKCSDEDTFYRVMKERIEGKKEPYPSTLKYDKVETAKLMPDNGIDKRALTIQNCDKIILKPKSLEVEVKIEKDNFDDFDYIIINEHKFKKV